MLDFRKPGGHGHRQGDSPPALLRGLPGGGIRRRLARTPALARLARWRRDPARRLGVASTTRTTASSVRRSPTPTSAAWAASDRGGAGAGKRFFVRRILEHVRATPAQERVIGAAVEEFRDEVKKNVGGEGRRSRKEIVGGAPPPHLRRRAARRAVRPPRHHHGERRARRSSGLVAKIHDALEPEQRERLADLVERGPRFGLDARGLASPQRW